MSSKRFIFILQVIFCLFEGGKAYGATSPFVGKWCYQDNEITITQGKSALNVNGIAIENSTSRAPNIGSLEFSSSPLENTLYNFDEYGCSAVLVLSNSKLLVADNGSCGGMNVRFNGTYSACYNQKQSSSVKQDSTNQTKTTLSDTTSSCVETSHAFAKLLPCNSCELIRKAFNGIADAYTNAGFPDEAIKWRRKKEDKPSPLYEVKNEKSIAIIHEMLRELAEPHDIKICSVFDGGALEVIQFRSPVKAMGVVMTYEMNGLVMVPSLGYAEF